eukprot:6202355-Pleurochrysis_carterae.AAC.3
MVVVGRRGSHFYCAFGALQPVPQPVVSAQRIAAVSGFGRTPGSTGRCVIQNNGLMSNVTY